VMQGLATAPNQRWRMDFVSDRLVGDRWSRVLTVVDQSLGNACYFTRTVH